MLRHFLTITFRHLRRSNVFTTVNILGLTLGTACALYILLYVREQYRFDRHHAGADHIFRIVTDLRQAGGGLWRTATCSPPIPPAMATDFPEVEYAARLVAERDEQTLRAGDKMLFADKGYYVDPDFFRIFTYRFVEGDPARAAAEPNGIVLTRTLARRLFGEQAALGREIALENTYGKSAMRVTGVVDEGGGRSHIRANFFLSMDSGGIGAYVRDSDHWAGNNFVHGYIRLRPGADAAAFEARLPAFLERHGAAQLRELAMQKTLRLEPLLAIHLHSDRENQVDTTVRASFIYLLLTIAILLQLIACINFMNLTTARATRRGREVGVRKVVGAGRSVLIAQFMGESLLLTFLAMALAIPLLNALLPKLNTLFGAGVAQDVFREPALWGLLLAIALGTGLLAGSYPAFYQSAFRPLEVLKGQVGGRGSAPGIRRVLVVFQFVVSIGLLVAVAVIGGQMRYIRSKDLGFAHDRQLILPFRTPDARARITAVKSALTTLPEVETAAAAAAYPGQFIPTDFNIFLPGKDVNSSIGVRYTWADEDYPGALNIPLLAGRTFTPADTSGQTIVNESLLRLLGIPPESAIGQELHSIQEGRQESYRIVGLMRDFHYESLYESITPFMLFYSGSAPGWLSSLIVRFRSDDHAGMLSRMRATWEGLAPGAPFEYQFLEDQLMAQYQTDATLMRIVQGFTGIALLISCLGLLGLAVFNAEQRVKEIGIRKVLGAGVGNIVALLSKEFLRLVGIAAVLAIPLSAWLLNRWLEQFAYRVGLQTWMFALAAGAALLLALLTVGFFALRAARANPVDALRSE